MSQGMCALADAKVAFYISRAQILVAVWNPFPSIRQPRKTWEVVVLVQGRNAWKNDPCDEELFL